MAKPQYGNWQWMPGHLEGEDVIIIASGPSLEGFDFNRINGMKKIVISHASKFVEPDFLVFLDMKVMKRLNQDFYAMPYRTIVSRNINLEPRGQVTRINYSGEPNLNPAHGFYGSFSSGHFATNLALAMNARTIYLLGHDCGGSKNNFYDTSQIKGYLPAGGGNRYKPMAKGYKKFEKFKNIVNLSIINGKDHSSIDCFPKKNIDEVL
jgi:hypothetical protein